MEQVLLQELYNTGKISQFICEKLSEGKDNTEILKYCLQKYPELAFPYVSNYTKYHKLCYDVFTQDLNEEMINKVVNTFVISLMRKGNKVMVKDVLVFLKNTYPNVFVAISATSFPMVDSRYDMPVSELSDYYQLWNSGLNNFGFTWQYIASYVNFTTIWAFNQCYPLFKQMFGHHPEFNKLIEGVLFNSTIVKDQKEKLEFLGMTTSMSEYVFKPLANNDKLINAITEELKKQGINASPDDIEKIMKEMKN